MSNQYGPRIVTNGLVLCLDAGNSKSYPGSGTTWNDLSGNGNNGTLVNGPTYSSVNKGSIVFDGVNDYIDCGNNSSINLVNNVSVNIWCYISGNPSGWRTIIAKRLNESQGTNYGINFNIFNSLQWYYDTGPSANFQVLSVPFTGNFVTNTWFNITGTFQQSGSNTIANLYKNGVLLKNQTLTGNIGIFSTNLVLGRVLNFAEYFSGLISSVQIYNTALSANQVVQNYNATKGRFV